MLFFISVATDKNILVTACVSNTVWLEEIESVWTAVILLLAKTLQLKLSKIQYKIMLVMSIGLWSFFIYR